ncbi:MAG: hypothetical protein EHM28_10940 [Spirochaetaceae bacterium]|nr:MAG: hypothetical protein EHM28_10940 [Spirochaetaceae bacterium]
MDKRAKLLKLLTIELEDLVEDVEQLLSAHEKRLASGEITNYVYQENAAVLKNEISCINEFMKEIPGFDLSRVADEMELAEWIKETFQQVQEEHCFSHAAEAIFMRKLGKALGYVHGTF